MIKKDIITKSLELRQSLEHLTNNEMAEKLGYHPSTWIRLKRGEISIDHMEFQFQFHVVNAYPDLMDTINIFVLENAKKVGVCLKHKPKEVQK
jgi:hypothetical protein